MYTLVIVIHIIACFILITAILLQSGRGGGLAGLFSGGASQTIFGARASTFLTRTTTVAAIAFLLTCISLTVFSSRRGKSLLEGKERVSQEFAPMIFPETIPGAGTQEMVEQKAEEIPEQQTQEISGEETQHEKPQGSELKPESSELKPESSELKPDSPQD